MQGRKTIKNRGGACTRRKNTIRKQIPQSASRPESISKSTNPSLNIEGEGGRGKQRSKLASLARIFANKVATEGEKYARREVRASKMKSGEGEANYFCPKRKSRKIRRCE